MSGISTETRIFFWIIAAIAGGLWAIIGNELGKNIIYPLLKRGRPPTRRPLRIWIIFLTSLVASIVFGALAAFAPELSVDVTDGPSVAQSLPLTAEVASTLQPDNWSIDYFANTQLNPPVAYHVDQSAEKNDNGGYTLKIQSVDLHSNSKIPPNNFSIRLTGLFNFEKGYYEFHCEHHDGCRVYVDGKTWVDAWWDGGGGHDLARDIQAGSHIVSIEFYDKGGLGLLEVTWRLTEHVVPTVPSTMNPDVETSSKDGMELLPVSEGNFMMGNDNGKVDEKPYHEVYLDTFWIDKTEVTIQMFSQFVSETGHKTTAEINGYGYTWFNNDWQKVPHANWVDPDGDGQSNKTNLPASQVSWDDAQAYCSWAGRRLPTEAEWEKAARGVDGRVFPWGDATPDNSLLSFNEESGIAIVGSYPNGASSYGALDMSGNVWEWTADWYDAYYYEALVSENPKGPISGTRRVLRGGAWNTGLKNIRITHRDSSEPQEYNDTLGFRCAK